MDVVAKVSTFFDHLIHLGDGSSKVKDFWFGRHFISHGKYRGKNSLGFPCTSRGFEKNDLLLVLYIFA